MRKIRMTSNTSISGIRLISGSSFQRLRNFMPERLYSRFAGNAVDNACTGTLIFHFPRPALVLPGTVQHVHQARSLLLHGHDKILDLAAERAEEDGGGQGDQNAEASVIERDGNAVRDLLRIGAARVLRAEDLDHADD